VGERGRERERERVGERGREWERVGESERHEKHTVGERKSKVREKKLRQRYSITCVCVCLRDR